jgi:integrase
LSKVNRSLVEDFKAWRLEESKKVKQSRGGAGVVLDAAILHRVFAYGIECEMLVRNPVRLEGRPGDNPEGGAEPYTAEELGRLREQAGPDMLAFLLLRHTGLRGSDAVGLTWAEVDWQAREINRLTQKRRKRVVVPIHTELLFALEAERDRRSPGPEDRVLLMDAEAGKPLTRPKLYNRILALGKRAGVPHAHPHRFRDTFAVDMLAKGASPYDVAKLLGDTVETVENHCAPFVRELRERARRIMETEGLEKIVGAPQVYGQRVEQKIQ